MNTKDVRIFLLISISILICVQQIEARPKHKVFHCAALITSKIEKQSKNGTHAHFTHDENDENGPHSWPGECNTGKSQSPIAYDQVSPVSGSGDNPLRMIGAFDVVPTKVSVINSGHGATYSLKFDGSSVPQITGGPLNNDVYNFASFHFHYPCEHLPDKYRKKCQFELHFVHFNSKYGTLDNAIHNPDGLAVIGVLYEVGNRKHAREFPFTSLTKYVFEPDTEFSSSRAVFTYADALGFDKMPKYVSYKGSLTTPGCFEAVTWIVVDHLYTMSQSDLNTFHKMQDVEGNRIKFNNRPLQPVNGRNVFIYNEL